MDKLNLIVRKDWREHQFQLAAENTQLWRIGQLIILLSALAVFWITLFGLPPLWQNFWRFALSFSVFLTFSLWFIIRKEPDSLRLTLLVFAAFLSLAAAAAYLDPRVPSGISDILPYWTVIVSLGIPAASWAIMLPIFRRFPISARRMGLHLTDWHINVLIGLMSGGALAIHLLFTTSLLPADSVVRLSFSRSALFWSFSLLAGLWVPGEEFLFRGLGFHLLYEEANNTFLNTVVRITLLNVLLYLVLALQNPSITLGVVTIVYRTGLSFINVFLFYRRKSLLPCMVANLVFTFVMLQLFQL